MKNNLKVVTRSSELALKQVQEIKGKIPGVNFDIIPVKSYGDKNKELCLIQNNIEDFFTKELDEMIINKQCDIAVHSSKDLPRVLSEELKVIYQSENIDNTDAFVSKGDVLLQEVPKGFRVGVSSNRRKEQVLNINPQVKVVSIRGDIDQRITLIEKDIIDGVVIATCALKRLGLMELVTEVLDFEAHPLQGSLSVVAHKDRADLGEIFAQINMKRKKGKVYIVGAGVGDPELITVKGMNVLKKADVVLYDFLSSKDLLSYTKRECEQICVGKKDGLHLKEQDSINEMLYEKAGKYNTVVRLKGGDPFIFSRGYDEASFLMHKEVEVEVIPGITSAIAAGESFGIPLTVKNKISSVGIITGRKHDKDAEIEAPDCATLIYLMGVANISNIVKALRESGREDSLACAFVERVYFKDSRLIEATIGTIEQKTKEFDVKAPSVLIVGEVVKKGLHKQCLLQKTK